MKYPIIGLVGSHCIGTNSPISCHSGTDLFATCLMSVARSRGVYYEQLGFGDAVKEDLARMLCITVQDLNTNKQRFRRMMQGYATDYMRAINPDVWLDRLRSTLDQQRLNLQGTNHSFIISDIRFENEAAFVRSQGGFVVRVTRHSPTGYPLLADEIDHISEKLSYNILSDAVFMHGSTDTSPIQDRMIRWITNFFDSYEQAGTVEQYREGFNG